MRLGADPEIFLQGRKDGSFKSIIGKIKADKWNPKQIDGLPVGFTLQEDNVALEFGVPPAATREEFIRNIRTVMLEGLKALPGEKFSKLSCTVFPKEEMNHPSAHVFGCEPDYNAWTNSENSKPVPPHPFMRSAGGHVHLETKLNKLNVIRACDLYLGVPSVLSDNGVERRQLYGKAGAFRAKSYGAEYRTLSNYWLFSSRRIGWVWDQSARALQLAEEFENAQQLIPDEDGIQECINTGNRELAAHLCKKFDLEVV